MRALATGAGVSLATPYNLFGSKRAIVLAVLDDVRAFHERFSHLSSADPLERIFTAADDWRGPLEVRLIESQARLGA
ncbi:hypothetical protein [Phenylobacterium sp.]|uniref:hypothetical protein n=1 Tax=Phenylobacterium sp. TaxID=1871053 RepID=UPI002722AFAE|nr:hypothetical protein [Phenylobacterium sp.]MDO8381258.1 hypothetical protein [Phenylobacterium sp.]